MDETEKAPAQTDKVYGFLTAPPFFIQPFDSGGNTTDLALDNMYLMYYPINESPIEVISERRKPDGSNFFGPMHYLNALYEDKTDGNIYVCLMVGGAENRIQKMVADERRISHVFSEADDNIDSLVSHNGTLYDCGSYGLRESKTGRIVISKDAFQKLNPEYNQIFSTGKNLYCTLTDKLADQILLKRIEEHSPGEFTLGEETILNASEFDPTGVIEYDGKALLIASKEIKKKQFHVTMLGETPLRTKGNKHYINGDDMRVLSQSEKSAKVSYYDRKKYDIRTAEINLEDKTLTALDAIPSTLETFQFIKFVLPITTAPADALLREIAAQNIRN
jgi:hypothetical protein